MSTNSNRPPARTADSPEFEILIQDTHASRVLADKAYTSTANRAAIQGRHRDGILRKAARGRPLRVGKALEAMLLCCDGLPLRHHAGLHPTERGAPLVKAGPAPAMFAAQFGYGHAILGLAQDRYDLGLADFGVLHPNAPRSSLPEKFYL